MSLLNRSPKDNGVAAYPPIPQEYSATDQEAHRDVEYRPPSAIVQTIHFIINEFYLFKHERAVYITLVLAIIPAIMVVIVANSDSSDGPMSLLGMSMFMAPFMVSLIASGASGKLIANEIKSRTAYMNLSYPINRASFTIGKFLAGFLISLAFVLMAILLSALACIIVVGPVDGGSLANAIIYLTMATFSFSAIAFFLGVVTNHGNMAGILVTFILLPIIVLSVSFASMLGYSMFSSVVPYLYLMPTCLPDLALYSLGSTGLSITGFAGSLLSIYSNVDMTLALGSGLAFGIVFVILSLIIVYKKDL